ncbi:thioesterase family protein [uncultured Tistrella sp.]|uniref:thioesterase family protein n=1 Tax=Tistrella mobilis TaxID=171437 RepID=UPI002601F681|nr:hypothetical protein [uncultured Tistrella sp.]
MSDHPKPGARAALDAVVTEDRTAAAFAAEGERFPAVLATPCLIADLERACALMLTPILAPGQLSVGAHIDVRHTAPTGVGGRYTAEAVFVEKAGPLYWFDVRAADAAGTIAKGRIARAIVVETDILARGAAGAGA